MRVAIAAPPTWPQPLAVPGALVPLHHRRPVRLGQVVEVAGAAVSAARTGEGFASGSMGFSSTGQALSSTGSLIGTTTAIAAVAPVLFGMAAIPVVGWIGAAVGALLMIAGSLFGGKPQLSHAQREALEVQRVAGTVGSMMGQIQGAASFDELWRILKSWQSGYVGGTSSVAVPIYFRPPGGDEGEAGANAAMKQAMTALVTSGGILLPPKWNQDLAAFMVDWGGESDRENYTGIMGGTFPGNQNQWYPVYTQQGFFSLFEQHPDWLRANTQAGVTRSMLVPINTNVRNTILNAMQRLGYRFTPGGGAALLFQTATPVPTGPDPVMVTNWVGQAYQQLLGRAPSSAERMAAVASLTAQQVTPEQFLTTLTSSAEFALAHGTSAAVTPSGTVVTGGAATSTGQPLSTYWWQGALLAPTAPGAAPTAMPLVTAGMVPSPTLSSSPWLLGVGALAVFGVLLFAGQPKPRRRR